MRIFSALIWFEINRILNKNNKDMLNVIQWFCHGSDMILTANIEKILKHALVNAISMRRKVNRISMS